jgi:hypothetical protein
MHPVPRHDWLVLVLLVPSYHASVSYSLSSNTVCDILTCVARDSTMRCSIPRSSPTPHTPRSTMLGDCITMVNGQCIPIDNIIYRCATSQLLR